MSTIEQAEKMEAKAEFNDEMAQGLAAQGDWDMAADLAKYASELRLQAMYLRNA